MILSVRSRVLPWRVCLELYSMYKLPKNWMLCWEHKLSCEFYTSTPSNCESVVKLQSWQGWSWRLELENQPAVCQVSFNCWWCLLQSVVCKFKEMEKIFRDNGINDADVLSFGNHLESYLKLTDMWEQLKSANLCTILLSLYFSIVWLAYRDSEAFGAEEGEGKGTYNGLVNPEDVNDAKAEEAGAAGGPAWAEGGGGWLSRGGERGFTNSVFARIRKCFCRNPQV